MRPSFIFATDLHGNRGRMNELVKKAIETECPHIILGGDLFGSERGSSIKDQIEFLEREVQPIFETFPGEVHTIFGNNDWGAVARRFSDFAPKIDVFEGGSFMLDEGIEVVGVSQVPVTPFPIKDWERIEATSPVPPMSRLKGYCSWGGDVRECYVGDERTMMDEFDRFGDLSGKILASHAPPRNTCADLGWGGRHLGSTDLREVIGTRGPIAVLSGHIHEAPELSGTMAGLLGDTWIANPGSMDGKCTFILGEVDECLRLTGFSCDIIHF